MYEVSICQCREWDWQMAITFYFHDLSEMESFVKLCIDHKIIVQIKISDED